MKNPSYVGRVVASDTSGELTIRNLNVSDQGYVAFAVTFRVGTSLTQKVYLNITSKYMKSYGVTNAALPRNMLCDASKS